MCAAVAQLPPDPARPRDAGTVESRPPDAGETEAAQSGRSRIERLRQRADFLRAASARRQGTAGFLLQARPREDAGDGPIRVGFTCSRKIGNAVARNRAKRRLRAIAAEVMPAKGRPGWDYVLVGRPEATIGRDFADLRGDLNMALDRVHSSSAQQARPAQHGRKGRGR